MHHRVHRTPSPSGALAVSVVLWTAFAAPAHAVGYVDGALNPADYVISIYTQTGTAVVSQSGAGNPGTALQSLVTVPSPSVTDHTETYFLQRGFVYSPLAQGVPISISFSIDKSVTLTPSTLAWGNGQGFILAQGGRLFETDVGLAAVAGTYLNASAVDRTAADFYLLTDPASHTADPTVHPDFSAGDMQFGFFNGTGVPVGAPDLQIRYLFDNFAVNVSTVPEPATPALWMAAGAAALALHRRRPVAAR